MAEYVYAIAPGWDGTIETLLLGGRVTTAFARIRARELWRRAAATVGRRAMARRRGSGARAGSSRLTASGDGLTRHLANGASAGTTAGGAPGRVQSSSPIRASHNPGASTSAGVGRSSSSDHRRVERALVGPFQDAGDEGAPAVDLFLADVEPEEAGEGLLALPLLDAVAVPGLAQRRG